MSPRARILWFVHCAQANALADRIMSLKFLHTTGRYSKFLAHYTVSARFYLCRTHALYILTLALRTISCQFDEIKCPTYQYCCDLLKVVFNVIIRALSLGIYARLQNQAQPSEYGVNRQPSNGQNINRQKRNIFTVNRQMSKPSSSNLWALGGKRECRFFDILRRQRAHKEQN